MNLLSLAGLDVKANILFKAPTGSTLNMAGVANAPVVLHSTNKIQDNPKVAILLCTYCGQRFLAEQLESFASQTYPHWEVWASDDGSEDGTLAILESYKTKWGEHKLSIQRGPGRGLAANFLSLTCNANIEADFYAYSDQDDIWESDKLERAVNWLKSVPPNTPALYCSRTLLVDAENRNIGFSPLFSKPPSFANALIQSIGGGNTMVFNNAARALLRRAGEDVHVVIHDWWAYMVVTGCGGRVFYDSQPSIRYRQHGGNLVGANTSWAARLARIPMHFGGKFRHWNDVNIEALSQIKGLLTKENREILDQFARARHQTLLLRIIGLKRSGVYRQTLFGNLGLVAAAILKKI